MNDLRAHRPITSTSPANQFVGIDQTITFGSPDGTTVLPATSGITDTGTTLTLLATGTLTDIACPVTSTHLAVRVSLSPFADAFDTYQTLTGAVLDSNTGLLRLTPDQFANLQSLFFQIGDVSRLHHNYVLAQP